MLGLKTYRINYVCEAAQINECDFLYAKIIDLARRKEQKPSTSSLFKIETANKIQQHKVISSPEFMFIISPTKKKNSS